MGTKKKGQDKTKKSGKAARKSSVKADNDLKSQVKTPDGKQNHGLFTPVNSGKTVDSPAIPLSQPTKVLAPGDSGAVDPSRPIGKGNPPRPDPIHQFKKGKSGNPKGYPKGKPNGSTIIKYWLSQSEMVENPISRKTQKLTQVDIMTLQQINQARKGNTAAFRELMDRTEGKPVQSTKLLNAQDKMIEITVGFKAPEAIIKPAPIADKKKEDPK